MDYPQNPNPIPNFSSSYCAAAAAAEHHHHRNHHHAMNMMIDPTAEFELSDYLVFDDHHGGFENDSSSQSMVSSEKSTVDHHHGGASSGSPSGAISRNCDIKCKNVMKKMKVEGGHRVAFRTKSELEVMDDGFKWRKYGKKSVKNSPNPRNYYKCSSGGCNVKKRVEREREDSSYVITTYEGIHNHESPCVVYYNHQMPSTLMVPSGWTSHSQASSSPRSSSSS